MAPLPAAFQFAGQTPQARACSPIERPPLASPPRSRTPPRIPRTISSSVEFPRLAATTARSSIGGCQGSSTRWLWRRQAQLLAPTEQLARVNPSLAGNFGGDRTRRQRRRNDPLLLCPRPAPASLHRCDDLNRLRHRTSPRVSTRTCPNESPPQGGRHRALPKGER
jgi:hypothetical protein